MIFISIWRIKSALKRSETFERSIDDDSSYNTGQETGAVCVYRNVTYVCSDLTSSSSDEIS